MADQVTDPADNPKPPTDPTPPPSDPAPPPDPADPQDPPKAQDNPDDPPKAKEGAPEKYELKPQEGAEFDPEFLAAYEGVARDLNLTNEGAQKLIDTVAPVLVKQQAAQFEAVRSEWAEASKADKEFGGKEIDANLSTAKKALDAFGSAELKEMLNSTGLGNHPEVIRFMVRAGKLLAEEKFVGGHTEGAKDTPKTFTGLVNALHAAQ